MKNRRADEIRRDSSKMRIGGFHSLCAMLLAATMLCACASSEASPEPKSLDAPTPDGVALKITGADEGQNVTVKVGTTFTVELVGIPTAGYLWAVSEAPSFIEAAGEYGGPTSSAQMEPGFTGGRHWEAFLFNVTAAGEGALRFEQRRLWEDESEPPIETFSVYLFAED